MPLSLSGTWSVHHDPLSQGLASHWHKNPPADGWKPIEIPSAWQTVLGPQANGVAWFRRDLPEVVSQWVNDSQSRVRLHFDAVATEARIWVRGVEAGQHLGDYLPFDIDITEALQRGEGPLELLVRVDQYNAPRPAPGVVVENGHITKGFHDVLSLQHAGIWCDVSVRQTGIAAILPNGVGASVSSDGLEVRISAQVQGAAADTPCVAVLKTAKGEALCQTDLMPGAAAANREGILHVSSPLAPWSPSTPTLYFLELTLGTGDLADHHTLSIGRRGIATKDTDGVPILTLNDRPHQIRGVLYWGHEPKYIAPCPPPEQVRREFAYLRELGFNCICFCMYYPPEYVYDIADETGMLVWQEHPVWKSRMTSEFMPEYHRLYEAFLRRDRRHPSVIIISGTCEHEAFDADLSEWWWKAAKRIAPDALHQVQTGFLEQTPPDQTDLYDDHVYDNCGRWVRFLPDMHAAIKKLGSKPFIMGETIISNAWPRINELRAVAAGPSSPPWWLTHGLSECEAFELALTRRSGAQTLERFKAQAAQFAIEFRKFQTEVFRSMDGNAGFVTNSIRDVPICRIGLKDDLDVWRFGAAQTRPWLADCILILKTPDHLRAFGSGETVRCEIGLSGDAPEGRVFSCRLSVDGKQVAKVSITPKFGRVAWEQFELPMPTLADSQPARILEVAADIEGERGGVVSNRWKLVVLPPRRPVGFIARLTGVELTEDQLIPEFEEHAYSSGWGLECKTWKPKAQRSAELFPDAAATGDHAGAIPASTKLLVTERLTATVNEYLKSGGRVLLLAHRHKTGMSSKWINLWGQLPLVIEDSSPGWPVQTGESDAILAMLHHDLTKWTTRAIPVDDLGLTDHVTPILRYVYTHDSGIPKLFDAVTTARVHSGLLIISTLDHTTPAGAYMLDRLVDYAIQFRFPPPDRELDITAFLS